MAENVVSLHGTFHPETAQVNATLVTELERLLEAAKAGEIVGLAGAYRHKDDVVSYSFAGLIGGFSMIGGIECLKDKLLRLVRRD